MRTRRSIRTCCRSIKRTLSSHCQRCCSCQDVQIGRILCILGPSSLTYFISNGKKQTHVTGTSSTLPYRGWLVRTPSATWSAPTQGLTPASAGPRWTQPPGSELIYSSFNRQQSFLTTTLWIHFPMYMLSNICREAGQLWGRGRLRLQQTRDSQEADFFIRFCQFSECLPAETRNLTDSFDLTGFTMETESGPY